MPFRTSGKNAEPRDPTRQAENDSAPFRKTSEAAARARQAPDEGRRADEPVSPGKIPGDDVASQHVSAVEDVSRANLVTPTRLRRPEERNPELETDRPDADKR